MSAPHFDGNARLAQHSDGRHWLVLKSFRYCSGEGIHVDVRKGLETDLASIPRLLWCVWPPFGKYTDAAVIHDALYRRHDVQRAIADGLFLEAMETSGVPRFTRYALWLGVRLFGWMFYRRKQQTRIEDMEDSSS